MSEKISEELKGVLNIDKCMRYNGVCDDIYKFNSIECKPWDFSLPTVVYRSQINNPYESKYWYIQKFYELQAPFLKNMDMSNIIIAGGSISCLLFHSFTIKHDVDIFVYGLDTKDANKKFMYILLHILKWNKLHTCKLQVSNLLANIYIFDTNNNFYKVQVIFRIYKTISEILHSFDVGPCSVGFDGDEFYFTSLSKFSYTYRAFPIDTTRNHNGFGHRIKKYISRGFMLILPNLDINSIMSNYFRVGTLCISVKCIAYNVIIIRGLPHIEKKDKVPMYGRLYKFIKNNEINIYSKLLQDQYNSKYAVNNLSKTTENNGETTKNTTEEYIKANNKQIVEEIRKNIDSFHIKKNYNRKNNTKSDNSESDYDEIDINDVKMQRDMSFLTKTDAIKFNRFRWDNNSPILDEVFMDYNDIEEFIDWTIVNDDTLTSSYELYSIRPDQWYASLYKHIDGF